MSRSIRELSGEELIERGRRLARALELVFAEQERRQREIRCKMQRESATPSLATPAPPVS